MELYLTGVWMTALTVTTYRGLGYESPIPVDFMQIYSQEIRITAFCVMWPIVLPWIFYRRSYRRVLRLMIGSEPEELE